MTFVSPLGRAEGVYKKVLGIIQKKGGAGKSAALVVP
jgi:hypothetical protein